jgi:hypothetical protein
MPLTLAKEILLLLLMSKSKEELKKLLELKNDSKHVSLSELLKQSAICQSALAKESSKQSNIHLL